jgi:hypothetical protein
MSSVRHLTAILAADAGSLSPEFTAEDVGDDPENNEHTGDGNAHQRGSEQQRNTSQSQNSDQQHQHGNGYWSERDNPDASVILAGRYPNP